MSVIERQLYEVNPLDHEWRKHFFAELPDYLGKYFAKRYISIYRESDGRKKANTYLREKMGGELQRRISLVLHRYRNLPTTHKITLMSEDTDQCDFDSARKNEQIRFDLESIKPAKAKSRLLAELEQDELKEMAFKISQIINARFELLSDQLKVESDSELDKSLVTAYKRLSELTASFGIAPPRKKKKPTAEVVYGDIFRMRDDEWWLKRLKKARKIMREHLAIAMGQVSKRASAYSSYDCVREHQEQQKKNWDAIQNMILFDEETKEEFELKDMVLKSISNPAIRRHELMTRTRGCENIAEMLGLSGLFLTLTTPGKYHNSYQRGGFIEHWNGASPRDAQTYLNGVWSRIRAKLGREEIRWFGVRVAEPHHDGTPHWHLLLWCKPEDKAKVTEIFIDYATKEDKSELMKKGVFDHSARCDVKDIDSEEGSATGYIAKYISKNIDGYAMDDDVSDEVDKPVKEVAKNVGAWKSRWNIRQFQFFGGAPVTTYRELRRLANLDKASYMDYLHMQQFKQLLEIYRSMTFNTVGPQIPNHKLNKKELMARLGDFYVPTMTSDDGDVISTMQAADTGDWQGYIMGQGGPFVKRDDLKIRNSYEELPFSSRYSETVRKLEGISAAGEFVKTRVRTWTIQTKSNKHTDVEAEALALDSSAAAPWSSVNNCTEPKRVQVSNQLKNIFAPNQKNKKVDTFVDENALNALLNGSSLNLHDGRSLKIRPGELDSEGNIRPAQLIEVEKEPEDMRWLEFDGWPDEPKPTNSDEYEQPNLSIFTKHDFGNDDWPLI